MNTKHSYRRNSFLCKRLRLTALLLMVLTVVITWPQAHANTKNKQMYQGQNLTSEQNFQIAMEAQTERDFSKMLDHLRQSAETGNVEAQEMLGMVLLVGPNLYGKTVKVDRCEAGKWMRRAVAQGSYVAKHQLDFLNRLRNSSGRDACRLSR